MILEPPGLGNDPNGDPESPEPRCNRGSIQPSFASTGGKLRARGFVTLVPLAGVRRPLFQPGSGGRPSAFSGPRVSPESSLDGGVYGSEHVFPEHLLHTGYSFYIYCPIHVYVYISFWLLKTLL